MSEIEQQASQHDFWSNPAHANELMSKLNQIKKALKKFDELNHEMNNLVTMLELSKEDTEGILNDEIESISQKILKEIVNYMR